jgi:hypothetical protein
MKLNREDVLEALGLSGRTFGDWVFPSLIGFGAGALIGAGCALLLAPRTGAELRGDLLERGRRIAERGRAKAEELASDVSRPQAEPRNY